GADDYMVKPFRREVLVARVRRILERTYGSQAIGATAMPELASVAPSGLAEAAAPSSSPAFAGGIDVAAALADLSADRDALRRGVESCESRIGELAARSLARESAANGSEPFDPAVLVELRGLVAEMHAAQERALGELRDDTKRALAVAEEALECARASAHAVPAVQFASMMTTVERLQSEQASLASAVASVGTNGDGADEECERRLRQATQEIEEIRTGVATLHASWQREAHEIRAEARTTAERALQRALAEQQEQRQQDAERLAGAEESARCARAEMLAASEQMSGELATLRRTLAEQRDGGLQIDARLEGAEVLARQAQGEMATTAARLSAELEALEHAVDARQGDHARDAGRIESAEEAVRAVRADLAAAVEQTGRDLAELRRLVTMQQEARSEDGLRQQDFDAALERVQREAIAAGEAAARSAQHEAMAASEQTARDLAQLRAAVVEQQGVQQQKLEWLQGRLEQARRAAVKLVRRVRAVATAADARATAREQACEQQMTAVREQTVAALAALRQDHAALTRDVGERLADLPSAAEHRTVVAFLDGCETQLTEFATRLDTQGQVRAVADQESRQRLASEVEAIKSVTERLDGEQRRLAADVEKRLRSLMRTAAGGFDVQLALLRGKVEVLARTLRERVPVDPAAPGDDGMLEYRYGLMDLLRQQLAVLQGSTDWRPQRVLDLLIESTLAAAVTPFRRLLQLTETNPPAEDPKTEGTATVTDESASPS
ncbi:MAG: hypothetical protein H6Q34_649, partial [Deltaproteobacteria bacterium]|nr:hypothetical protein [Deltaproteobacteria bacterium]